MIGCRRSICERPLAAAGSGFRIPRGGGCSQLEGGSWLCWGAVCGAGCPHCFRTERSVGGLALLKRLAELAASNGNRWPVPTPPSAMLRIDGLPLRV